MNKKQICDTRGFLSPVFHILIQLQILPHKLILTLSDRNKNYSSTQALILLVPPVHRFGYCYQLYHTRPHIWGGWRLFFANRCEE